jgi:integral membrane protein (TIGR00529 family)
VAIGYALVAGAATIGLLFGTDWGHWPRGFGSALGGVAKSMGNAAKDPDGLQLLGLVLLITFLGTVLKRVESLGQLIGALKSLLRDRRVAMAVAPAFVGLLPMPGGAAFSAPMVGELTEDVTVPREDATLINFWFRHVWEWTWPLYPAVLFASKITGAPLDRIVLAQLPCTVGAIVIGSLVCFRRLELPASETRQPAKAGTWGELLAAVWPVALVVVATVVFAVAKQLGGRLGLRCSSSCWS